MILVYAHPTMRSNPSSPHVTWRARAIFREDDELATYDGQPVDGSFWEIELRERGLIISHANQLCWEHGQMMVASGNIAFYESPDPEKLYRQALRDPSTLITLVKL